MNIHGTSALVTGGASGLGLAAAQRLAADGAAVVLLDLDCEAGEAAAQQMGPRVQFCAGDVTDESQVGAAVQMARDLAPLRIAVSCAGMAFPAARTVSRGALPHALETFRTTVEVNLVGTFNVARLAAAEMSRTPAVDASGSRGVIVNTASLAAFDGQTGQVAYAASKAGVAGMTLPLARDLAVVGVRVCTIAPGTFDTPILHSDDAPEGVMETLVSSLLADHVHPKRLGDPAEFAGLVRHIIDNDMLNGETIRLDAAARLRPNPGR